MMKHIFLSVLLLAASCLPAHSAPEYRTTISNLHINAFAQDRQGFVWIATAKGLCRYDGYGFDIFSNEADNPSSLPSDNAIGLYIDSDGSMWVATAKGLCRYDALTAEFERFQTVSDSETFLFGLFEYKGALFTYGLGGIYKVDRAQRQSVPHLRLEGKEVWAVCADSNNNLWCICDKGEVLCFDESMNLLRKFDLGTENEAYCATPEKGTNRMLIGTKRGIVGIDTKTLNIVSETYDFNGKSLDVSTITTFEKDKRIVVLGTKNEGLVFYDTKSASVADCAAIDIQIEPTSNDIRCVFVDKAGLLWVGSFDKGFFIGKQEENVFDTESPLFGELRSQFVTRVAEDARGNLYVGTRYNGILRYDKATGKSEWFNSSNTPALSKYKTDFVQSLLVDSHGMLWVGYEQSTVVADISGKTVRFVKTFDNTGNVVTMAEDANGRVWTGKSSGGISIYGANLERLDDFSPVLRHNNITKIIALDKENMLFSAFGDNIYKININTLKTTVLNRQHKDRWKNAVTMMRDRSGNLWIGTYGNGLFRYRFGDGELTSYSGNSGFQSNDIIGIAEDLAGCVWLSSSYGIYRMDPVSQRVQAFFRQDGTSGDQMHEKSALQGRDGTIYFGGNDGLTEIHPQNIKPAPTDIPLFLTDLRLFNQRVAIGGDDGVLSKVISMTDTIELRHDQNVFSIDFTGLTYNIPPRLNYAYRLVGFDKDWNYVGSYKRASYSNLASGEYVFELMAQNKDGVWTEPKQLLRINVLPSPWLHPAALVAYAVLAIGILFLSISVFLRLKLGKERYAMAQKEIAREKSLAQMKMNFFTNISHELRTPLTMIYGPVKTLLTNRKPITATERASLLSLINSNVERLMRLVDQLLDFGRVENDTLELKVSHNDCLVQLKSVINLYRLYVADKNITVEFNCPYDSLNLVYDPDKLDKIMNNLLFNSSKYTPVDGHITVCAGIVTDPDGFAVAGGDCHTWLRISVEDDGIGLDKKEFANLFVRFKRLVKGKPAEEIKGSGIGMNFVKHLVENHKGAIKAENCADKGCRFTFIIPADDSAYTKEEHAEAEYDAEAVSRAGADGGNVPVAADAAAPSGKSRVLVVEDNAEVRQFLDEMLRIAGYEVTLAVDGVDGLQKAAEAAPDVIVSDVIMPNMDGYEFCAKVKSNQELCHIPTVLLTAKKLDSDFIKGYDQGADMYLAKPFNPEMLLSILSNMIRNSDRRRQFIMRHSGTAEPIAAGEGEEQEPDISPLDKKFLKKLYDYIDANISNCELNVNYLGRELGFSRTNFYRKVKALTGESPNDFLRVYRLNRAAELIRQREHTLSEISEMAGFGTQSHFSTSFKKHFGVPPKDYLSSTKRT